MPTYVGLDIGTTAVKGAVVDTEGRLVATTISPMPPLQMDERSAAWQDLAAVERAADTVLDSLIAVEPTPTALGLTTQRDTVVLIGSDGTPRTPLISWRDGRDVESATLWDALAREGMVFDAVGAARSVASHLGAYWCGRAVEAAGTQSRHLGGSALERLLDSTGPGLSLPETVRPGGLVGEVRGIPMFASGGDKNCEYLGLGVLHGGCAGLSLGSAISLGAITEDRPPSSPGLVVTPASIDDAWNVETGIVGGLDGQRFLDTIEPSPPPLTDAFTDAPWMLPYFAGALDAPRATPEIVGATDARTPTPLRHAWAQGVLGELRRLMPKFEAATGARVEEIRMGGGGAGPAWAQLAADALCVPVRLVQGRWSGARGAVAALLMSETPGVGREFLRRGLKGLPVATPDPSKAMRVERYYETWNTLSHAARLKAPT